MTNVPISTAMRARYGSAFVSLAAAAAFAAAPAFAQSAPETYEGAPVRVGDGTAQTFVRTDAAGKPTAFGVIFTPSMLEGLPKAAAGGSPDFTVDVFSNAAPTLAAPGQFRMDGVTAIPDGGTTNESSAVFRATLDSGDPGQLVRLQVELRPNASPLIGTATAVGIWVSSGTAAEQTRSATSGAGMRLLIRGQNARISSAAIVRPSAWRLTVPIAAA